MDSTYHQINDVVANNSRLSEKGNDCSYLDTLPTEILETIFLFLPYRDRTQLKLVCSRLREIGCNPHLWKEIVWNHYSISDDPQLCHLLTNNGSIITKLDIDGCFDLSAFCTQLMLCSNLRTVILNGNRCATVIMEEVIKGLPALTHVEFEPCNTPCIMERCNHFMCKAHEWREFLTAAKGLSSLTLIVPWQEHLIEFLLREWSMLKYYPLRLNVSISGNGGTAEEWRIRYSGLLELWQECQCILKSCAHPARFCLYCHKPNLGLCNPPLFELGLSNSPSSLSGAIHVARLQDVGVESDGIVRLCGKSLDSKSFSTGHYLHNSQFCLSPSEASFQNFHDISANLTYLNFANATSLLSSHIEVIADSCVSLTQLNLKGCSLSLNPLYGLAALASRCPGLKALNIQDIPSSAVESVSEMWYILSQIRRLSHLAIDPCLMQSRQVASDTIDNVEQMLEAVGSMNSVVSLEVQTKCSDVGAMECAGCQAVSPQHLTLFLTSGLKYVRHLRVETLPPLLCSAVAEAVLTTCKSLKTLYIVVGFAFRLSARALLQTDLQQLYVKCPRMSITDSIIDPLISRNNLTHLYLFVRSVSKTTIFKILQNFPRLIACHIYSRDRAVMLPPDAILEFRKMVRQLFESRFPIIEDFFLEEDTFSFTWVDPSTTRSIHSSELLSAWI